MFGREWSRGEGAVDGENGSAYYSHHKLDNTEVTQARHMDAWELQDKRLASQREGFISATSVELCRHASSPCMIMDKEVNKLGRQI